MALQVPGVPLLPKLRGHFAEFLLHKSLEHLRLLASPTCVRLRYGHPKHSPPRLFSAVGSSRLQVPRRGPLHSRLGSQGLLTPQAPTRFDRDFHPPALPSLLRPPCG